MPTKNKDIQKKHRDAWYKKNKKKQIDRQMIRRKELKASFQSYKRELNCADCGFSFKDHPECCDFHHTNPEFKIEVVSRIIQVSKLAFEKELVKCIPLCANCHRIRHFSHGIG